MAALDVDDAQAARAERDAVGLDRLPRSFGPRCVITSVIRVERLGRDDIARLPADLDHAADAAHVRAKLQSVWQLAPSHWARVSGHWSKVQRQPSGPPSTVTA